MLTADTAWLIVDAGIAKGKLLSTWVCPSIKRARILDLRLFDLVLPGHPVNSRPPTDRGHLGVTWRVQHARDWKRDMQFDPGWGNPSVAGPGA
jgi:hypothetical protein